MKAQRAPFQPLSADIDDEEIERLAREKGVGAIVKPARREREQPLPETTSRPQRQSAPTAEGTSLTAMKTVNVELPDYVWTALKIRATERQTSVRHVIMTALRGDGIAIVEADMIDASLRTRGGQRDRGSRQQVG